MPASYTKQCTACGVTYVTHKPKSKRCPDCIAAGRKSTRALTAVAVAIEEARPAPAEEPVEQTPIPTVEQLLEEERKERRAEAKRKRRERAENQLKVLNASMKVPKGLTEMKQTNPDYNSAMQTLWRDLAWVEGCSHPLLRDTQVETQTKVQMATTFNRLKLSGLTTGEIVNLDISKFLNKTEEQIEKAFEKLIKSEPKDEPEVTAFDHCEDLDPAFREAVLASAEEQQRKAGRMHLELEPQDHHAVRDCDKPEED